MTPDTRKMRLWHGLCLRRLRPSRSGASWPWPCACACNLTKQRNFRRFSQHPIVTSCYVQRCSQLGAMLELQYLVTTWSLPRAMQLMHCGILRPCPLRVSRISSPKAELNSWCVSNAAQRPQKLRRQQSHVAQVPNATATATGFGAVAVTAEASQVKCLWPVACGHYVATTMSLRWNGQTIQLWRPRDHWTLAWPWYWNK